MAQHSIRRVAIAALFTLAACAGPLGDPEKSASKSLSVEGGQVSTPSGSIAVTIPAGALRRPTLITVTPASADQVRPVSPSVGEMYEFGPEGQTFDVPARVKLEVDLARLPAGYSIADVVVQRAPVGTAAFEVLPTHIIDATHVEADTLHFSVFVPTLNANRTTDGGVDGGVACAERCVTPNDGGADCECSRVCGQETLEIQCSGASPLGCACVRNGVQVGFVTTLVCPAASDLDRLCGFSSDAGVDGGVFVDGGVSDGGVRPDGGVTDGGLPTDGGVADGGTAVDGGIRPDGGVSDGGTTVDGGVSDGGLPTDAGTSDGGIAVDAGTPDAGVVDGGTSVDAGTPDAGVFDGGVSDGGIDAGTPDAGLVDAGP
jgi:hypothetical protein